MLTFHQFTHESLECGRWSILRHLPKDQLWVLSAVDCLDQISQTRSGQERLKKLKIELHHYNLILFLEGSLLQILRRFRGLQSLHLELNENWTFLVPTSNATGISDWTERFGRDFLLLIKIALGQIKVIKLFNDFIGDAALIPRWMSYELEKRNKAWVPPPPAYMEFHRTPSSMSVLHPQINERLADAEARYKPKTRKKRVSYLEGTYGVFP